MNILGIGGIGGDAACALLKNGELSAAVEENKVSRQPQAGDLPRQAIASCLEQGDVTAAQVDCVALARPLPSHQEEAIYLDLRERFPNSRLAVVEHHLAHAASAYYASGFEDAAVLALDRSGDFRCGSLWRGTGTQLTLEKDFYFPDSLGDLYGRVTELLGFRPNADEHKVQWLSTSGGERLTPLFSEIIGPEWPRLDRTFFETHRVSQGGFSHRFYEALGLSDGAAVPESLRTHIARGMQSALEQKLVWMTGGAKRVCLAGGLGYNALLVEALERNAEVFVQPAAGNAGTSVGAVYHAWHSVFQQPKRAGLKTLYLGPSYSAEQIKRVIENCKLRFRYLLTTEELVDTAVGLLNENLIVAWMHGRMEFGPRALGNRSILASPLNPYSTENLNVYIKHREPFRKFAASVPAELASEYFEAGSNARFLATVGRVKPAHRKTFESAVLGQDLVRVHTVSEEDNPLYYRLLLAAGKSTGLPVLYNTSFNLFGDPLVCTPRDAVRSFYSSGIDALMVGNFLLQK